MNRAKSVISSHEIEQGSYRSYVTGFLLSLALTLGSYALVVNHALSSKWGLAILVSGLALIQCAIQLTLFLHLGKETKPRLRLLVFCFMFGVVLVLVSGSIWIMYNLNNRMKTPNQVNQYMQSQDDAF
jgi:cytochrome o ubiquinol oxidase operon protein cyoD